MATSAAHSPLLSLLLLTEKKMRRPGHEHLFSKSYFAARGTGRADVILLH